MDTRVFRWRIAAHGFTVVDRLGKHARIRCGHRRMTTAPFVGRRIPRAVIREIEDDLSCCLSHRGGL